MAATDKQVETTTESNADDKPKSRDVAEYLQAPRRKRKSYVLVACGGAVPPDVQGSIDSYIKQNHKNVAIAHPRSPDELTKLLNRQVVLLVYDDEFADMEQGLNMILDLKKRKTSNVIPVLFLTRSPETLVNAYNQYLLPFHEADEYINYAKSTTAHILNKVKAGIANKNRRRSRRYKIDIDVAYFTLSQEGALPGRLIDLSVHGALMRSEENRIFKLGDQLKLHIPIADVLPNSEGDYLRISAKVRRVFIGGSQAGISFEYVSEKQNYVLTRFVTELVNAQNIRRSAAMKSKVART